MSRHAIGQMLAAVALVSALLAPAAAVAATVAPPTNPNDPTSAQLVETPKKYDGKRVIFQGEVIGDVMRRGDYAWLHLNDDAYMFHNVEEGAPLGGFNSGMPVWIASEKTRQVRFIGDYKHEGDVVLVEGTFNAACAEHGGDMDIHASSLRVVVGGRDAQDPVKTPKVAWALGLTVVAGLLWYAERNLGMREMKGYGRSR